MFRAIRFVLLIALLSFVSPMVLPAQSTPDSRQPPETSECSTTGCAWAFHPSTFSPSGIFSGAPQGKYPNDYAKTFYCDAPWRVSSLDDMIPIYCQIEGNDADRVNEMESVAVYDVSTGAVPPDPVESWGNYQYTPNVASQVYTVECGGCPLTHTDTGMYWLIMDTFRSDGSAGPRRVPRLRAAGGAVRPGR